MVREGEWLRSKLFFADIGAKVIQVRKGFNWPTVSKEGFFFVVLQGHLVP